MVRVWVRIPPLPPAVALMTGMLLYILDSSRGGTINISAKHRRKLNEEIEKKQKEAEGEGEGEGDSEDE